jgi:hypothetical protein
MDVGCNGDYVDFGIKDQTPMMTLCPLNTVGRLYTMLPRPEGETFSNWKKNDLQHLATFIMFSLQC